MLSICDRIWEVPIGIAPKSIPWAAHLTTILRRPPGAANAHTRDWPQNRKSLQEGTQNSTRAQSNRTPTGHKPDTNWTLPGHQPRAMARHQPDTNLTPKFSNVSKNSRSAAPNRTPTGHQIAQQERGKYSTRVWRFLAGSAGFSSNLLRGRRALLVRIAVLLLLGLALCLRKGPFSRQRAGPTQNKSPLQVLRAQTLQGFEKSSARCRKVLCKMSPGRGEILQRTF